MEACIDDRLSNTATGTIWFVHSVNCCVFLQCPSRHGLLVLNIEQCNFDVSALSNILLVHDTTKTVIKMRSQFCVRNPVAWFKPFLRDKCSHATALHVVTSKMHQQDSYKTSSRSIFSQVRWTAVATKPPVTMRRSCSSSIGCSKPACNILFDIPKSFWLWTRRCHITSMYIPSGTRYKPRFIHLIRCTQVLALMRKYKDM